AEQSSAGPAPRPADRPALREGGSAGLAGPSPPVCRLEHTFAAPPGTAVEPVSRGSPRSGRRPTAAGIDGTGAGVVPHEGERAGCAGRESAVAPAPPPGVPQRFRAGGARPGGAGRLAARRAAAARGHPERACAARGGAGRPPALRRPLRGGRAHVAADDFTRRLGPAAWRRPGLTRG